MSKTARLIKTNTTELQFPYNSSIIERVKKLSGRKYLADKKVWQITIDFRNCFELERIIKENNFIVDNATLDKILFFKEEAKSLVKNSNQQIQILPTPTRVKNALDELGFNLRPYQAEGFSAMVNWRKAINGCEMGLGKTLQTLTALEYLNAYPALVICPASLKYNWQAEIKRYLPGRKVKVIDKVKDVIYSGAEFYIINYDILSKKMKDLERINFMGVVADESQYIKSKTAQRSKAAVSLIRKIPTAYLLSGTLIENRPSELINQLEALDQLTNLGGYWTFINRYCEAKHNGFGLDINGAKNIEELYLRMSRSFYFRRNKADVLKELPPKIYNNLNVELTNRKEYDYAQKELVNYLQEKVLNEATLKQATKGMSSEQRRQYIDDLLDQQEEKVSSAEHLVLMTTLRKVTANGKIAPAKDWVTNFLETSNEKILIFAWHTEVVMQLATEFNCKSIYGGVSSKERQDIVDDFQNNPDTRVLILNIKAGGVGLNLTKSSTVLFIEEPYNPALKLQAEDRAHRIGQKDTVNVYTMIAVDSIDQDINNLIQQKLHVVNTINAGKFSEQHNDLNIMKELLMKMMSK